MHAGVRGTERGERRDGPVSLACVGEKERVQGERTRAHGVTQNDQGPRATRFRQELVRGLRRRTRNDKLASCVGYHPAMKAWWPAPPLRARTCVRGGRP